jgi:hypothetical protein
LAWNGGQIGDRTDSNNEVVVVVPPVAPAAP